MTQDKYTLVEYDDPAQKTLRELVSKFHSDLAEAEIALVYEHDVKPDCDGHLVWGRAKKVGPLEQSFREHDFTILLNAEVWAKLPAAAKRALLDHELTHCGCKTDDAGESTYYLRKHDLEEFTEIVRRYGLWRTEVESFVNAALRKECMPLFPQEAKPLGITEEDLEKHGLTRRDVHLCRDDDVGASLCGAKETGDGWLSVTRMVATCKTCLSMDDKQAVARAQDLVDAQPIKKKPAKRAKAAP